MFKKMWRSAPVVADVNWRDDWRDDWRPDCGWKNDLLVYGSSLWGASLLVTALTFLVVR